MPSSFPWFPQLPNFGWRSYHRDTSPRGFSRLSGCPTLRWFCEGWGITPMPALHLRFPDFKSEILGLSCGAGLTAFPKCPQFAGDEPFGDTTLFLTSRSCESPAHSLLACLPRRVLNHSPLATGGAFGPCLPQITSHQSRITHYGRPPPSYNKPGAPASPDPYSLFPQFDGSASQMVPTSPSHCGGSPAFQGAPSFAGFAKGGELVWQGRPRRLLSSEPWSLTATKSARS